MNAKALSFLVVPAAIVGGYALWPKHAPVAPAAPVAPPTERAVTEAAPANHGQPSAEVYELMDAIAANKVKVECKGNGRDRLWLTIANQTSTQIALKFPVGQMFESERNAVVVVRAEGKELAARGALEVSLQTAATRSLNKVAEVVYRPTYNDVPKIELFLTYVQDHLELSPGAIQTAILALAENLPVSALAKFTPTGGAIPSRFNTDAFRVETFDLIQALAALREIGVKDRDLALTIDPQLKIEAMIEPLCRAAAMRYYGIAAETEWEYWRAELLEGDPSTRHYALFGIARFYPEIALEMLPRWVREKKTNPAYRLAAIQALADTQRTEALTMLESLVDELGADTDLGKAAAAAAKYLDSHLAKVAAIRTKVVFRSASGPAGF